MRYVVFRAASHPDKLAELEEAQFKKQYPDAEQCFIDADMDNTDCPSKHLLYFQSVYEDQIGKVKELNKAKKLGKKGNDAVLVPDMSEFYPIAEWWGGARSQ